MNSRPSNCELFKRQTMDSLYSHSTPSAGSVHSYHQPEESWSSSPNSYQLRSMVPFSHHHNHQPHHNVPSTNPADAQSHTNNSFSTLLQNVPQCPPPHPHEQQRNKFWNYNIACYQRLYNDSPYQGHSMAYDSSSASGGAETGGHQPSGVVEFHGSGGVISGGQSGGPQHDHQLHHHHPQAVSHLTPTTSQFMSDTSSSSAGSFILFFEKEILILG